MKSYHFIIFIDISFKNNLKNKNTNYMFYKYNSLKNINLSNFNIQNITNMEGML